MAPPTWVAPDRTAPRVAAGSRSRALRRSIHRRKGYDMNRLKILVSCTVLAVLVSAVPAFAQKALVWATGDSDGNPQTVARYFTLSGCYTQVDVIQDNLVPLSTLVQYDAVFYFS